MNEKLYRLHEQFKKHECSEIHQFWNEKGDEYTYLGACACGALYAWESCICRDDTKHTVDPKEMTFRACRYWTPRWMANALRCIKQHPKLLVAYKALPYISFNAEDFKDECNEVRKAERKVFGKLIKHEPGYYPSRRGLEYKTI